MTLLLAERNVDSYKQHRERWTPTFRWRCDAAEAVVGPHLPSTRRSNWLIVANAAIAASKT